MPLKFEIPALRNLTKRVSENFRLLSTDFCVLEASFCVSYIKSAETGWFYARHIVIQGAGHFFASDPILEPGSRSSEAAGPIRRFFEERL